MSKNYALKGEKRDRAGKGIARALRREGKIPAVIYGDNKAPVTIALDGNAINVEYNRGHMHTTLCDMDVEGEKHLVLARDVQLHPVTDVVIHADFLRVTSKTRIAVNVPVNFINEEGSPGLRGGGVLSVVRYDIELVCSATAIPDAIDVDLDGVDVGDTVKISDVKLPEGVTPAIDDRDFSIASVVAPRKAAEPTESESEDGAEDGEGSAEEGAEGDAAEGGAEE